MVKHGVGVWVRVTYTIQTVDEDYFGQERTGSGMGDSRED
jgi:ribosomal protein L16/L10AE